MTNGDGAGPCGTESPDGESDQTQGQHSTTSPKTAEKNRRLED